MKTTSTLSPSQKLLSFIESQLNLVQDFQNEKVKKNTKQGQHRIDHLNFYFEPENRKIEVDVYFTGKRETAHECAEVVLKFIKQTNWDIFLGKDFEHFKVKQVPTKISDFLSKQTIEDWDEDEIECGCGTRIVFQTTVKGMTETRKIFREKQKSKA